MGIKYKLKLKDLKLEYLIEYFKPILKFFKPKEKINNYEDLKNYIQKKSAWISQVTLYGYLKTRMGAKHVLMFEDEIFLGSINKAKWNIYAVTLQDFCLYSISYLKDVSKKHDTEKAKEIFLEILSDEEKNQMPNDILEKSKIEFDERLKNIERHKRSKHMIILCKPCNKDFVDQGEKNHHELRVHLKNVCSICKKTFRIKE